MRFPWLLLPAVLAPAVGSAEGSWAHFAFSAGAGRGLSGPSLPADATGLTLGGGAYVELGRTFALGVEATSYAHLSDLQSLRIEPTERGPTPTKVRTTFTSWRIAPALEWRADTGALRPRVSASLGYYKLSERTRSESSDPRLNYDAPNEKGTLGAGLSVGLDYFFHSRFGVGVELHYDSVYEDFDRGLNSWANVAAGVRF
jgi:hypothetical protein